MTPEQVRRLRDLRTAQPPRYVRRHFDGSEAAGRIFPFVDELDEPSDEYVQRVALEEQIIAVIRAEMETGRYEGSGRRPSGYERIYLETGDWSSASISLEFWTIGRGERLLSDIEITSATRPSNDDLLAQIVLDCLSSLRASATTKTDVRALATTQATFSITPHMFERAWERALECLPANEREAWTRAGPRRNQI